MSMPWMDTQTEKRLFLSPRPYQTRFVGGGGVQSGTLR